MKKYNIQNIDELRTQRAMLKQQSKHQLQQLKSDFNQYKHQFTIKGLLGEHINYNSVTALDQKLGLSSKLLSVLVPTLLNRTIFRKSGFLSKLLVGFAGAKLGNTLDLENVSGIFNLAKNTILDFLGSKKTASKPITTSPKIKAENTIVEAPNESF